MFKSFFSSRSVTFPKMRTQLKRSIKTSMSSFNYSFKPYLHLDHFHYQMHQYQFFFVWVGGGVWSASVHLSLIKAFCLFENGSRQFGLFVEPFIPVSHTFVCLHPSVFSCLRGRNGHRKGGNLTLKWPSVTGQRHTCQPRALRRRKQIEHGRIGEGRLMPMWCGSERVGC